MWREAQGSRGVMQLKLPAAISGPLEADSTVGNSVYFKFARCFGSKTSESATPAGIL